MNTSNWYNLINSNDMEMRKRANRIASIAPAWVSVPQLYEEVYQAGREFFDAPKMTNGLIKMIRSDALDKVNQILLAIRKFGYNNDR